MKLPLNLSNFLITKIVAALVVAIVAILAFHFVFDSAPHSRKPRDNPSAETNNSPPVEVSVNLTDSQLNAIKIGPIEKYDFRLEKEEVGSVAYHEKGGDQETRISGGSHFIVANVLEGDSPLIHVGQPVQAKLLAYPDHVFEGKVSAVGVTVYDTGGNPALDPNTHRISVRCEMSDLKNELYPGMLAMVVFQIREPIEALALSENGVVREGDGTMTAWTTMDRHHFTQRIIKVGLREDGKAQILDGLNQGELAVTDGAIFLDNMLQAPSDD